MPSNPSFRQIKFLNLLRESLTVFMFCCYFVFVVHFSLDVFYIINFMFFFYISFHVACASVICALKYLLTYTHTHPFNGPLSGTTQVSQYQKGKTNLDFPEVRDSEWQWHQLGHIQVCTSLQTDNHASTPPLSFLQAGCPSCHPTYSVKALMAVASVGPYYSTASTGKM